MNTIKFHSSNSLLQRCFSCVLFLMFIFYNPLLASNQSDADTLKNRCEKDSTQLEIPVTNFGDESDREEFKKGEKLIRLGKVKFVQTKYPEAIDKFNEYLLLQSNLYKSLSEKYLERTEKMIDTIAEELVDDIDNKKVEEYLRLANQNLKDAKSEMQRKNYKNVVKLCRLSKSYAISAYGLVGKSAPDEYKKDSTDNDNKIYK